MTRETALRRMLAGQRVEHPQHPGFFFEYQSNKIEPINAVNIAFLFTIKATILFFSTRRTGWKEYRVGK